MTGIGATLPETRNRVGHVVLYAIAAVYFVVDVAFLSVIRPLRRRLLGGGRLHGWIEGLNRYAALSLVVVPLAILEPVKPLGFYLSAKGHLFSGGSIIAVGEIVKITLVEQVIEITKPKLLSFHWFAWAYSRWEAVLGRLRSLRAWQAVKGKVKSLVARLRKMKAHMETRRAISGSVDDRRQRDGMGDQRGRSAAGRGRRGRQPPCVRW